MSYIGSFSRPMYPVGERDCPDGCGAYVGEGCYNAGGEPMVNLVIVNTPEGGLDSVHPECLQEAERQGFTREVDSRGPAYELYGRDCPVCVGPLRLPAATRQED